MNRAPVWSPVIALICLWLEACTGFSPRPDPSRFFVLSPLPQAEQAQAPDRPGRLSLGVGPIRFPAYLDREQIVTRIAPNRFELSETDRWAEPLEENFARVLSQNLAALLRTDQIISYPWPASRRPIYQVQIEVMRFEASAERDAQLLARWRVLEAGDKKPVREGESRLTRPAKSGATADSVAALSEVLGDLSRAIADALRAIDGQRKL